MIKLGTYQLGYQWVDVYADPTSREGSFLWDASKRRNGRIVVGVKNPDYDEVLATLMHEAAEVLACELGLRYNKSDQFSDEAGAFSFLMNHSEFSELMARLAQFLNQVEDDLNATHQGCQPN